MPPADLERTLSIFMPWPRQASFNFTRYLLIYEKVEHYPRKGGQDFKEGQQWQMQQGAVKMRREECPLNLTLEVKGNLSAEKSKATVNRERYGAG